MHDTTHNWKAQLRVGRSLLLVVVIATIVALALNVRAGLEVSIEAAMDLRIGGHRLGGDRPRRVD
jgi:hypothetical protein